MYQFGDCCVQNVVYAQQPQPQFITVTGTNTGNQFTLTR